MRSTDTDNPIDKWTDEQLAESMRAMLRTVSAMAEELVTRGYSVTCNRFVHCLPTTVSVKKEVIL